MVKNGNFTLLLISSGQERQFHIATEIHWSRIAISHCYCQLLVKNGNFTLLLISSGQERQFHNATDIHWSRLAISHCYWYLVVKFGRWTFFTWWSTQYQWKDTFNTSTKKLTRWTYFGCWTPQMLNGNFTLLLIYSGQEWQFHSSIDI